MNDEKKPGQDAVASKSRAPASIDLSKADVKDVTPKAEEAVATPEPATPDAPVRNATSKDAPGTGDQPRRAQIRADEAAPSARNGGSSLPVIGGAVAGAIFGLLGSTIHQNYAAPPVTVADPRVAQVEAAIAVVDKKAQDAAGLEQKLAAQIKAIEARAAAVEQKAAAVEQRAAAVEQKASSGVQKAASLLGPLEDRLKSAEARLAQAVDAAGQLARKVDLLAQVEPPKVDVAPLLAPLASRLDALEKTLGSTAARVTLGGEAAQGLDARIKAAEQAVADLRTKKPGEAPAAILGVTAMVRRALEAGEPLGSHLAALSGLGVPEAALRPLTVFAEKPAPKPAALAEQMSALVAALPKPKVEPPVNPGLMDRIKSGLLSQVEVRPVGGVAADLGAMAGRARTKLLADDIAGALAELSALSPEQAAALKPFTDAASARAGAFDALRALDAATLAAAARKS